MILTRRDGAATPAQEARPAAPRVVADLQMEPGRYAGDLRVKGEIVVPEAILQPALARIAGQFTNTRDAKVEFDAQNGTFVLSGKYTGLPLWHPRFKLTLRPVNEGGRFGFKVVNLEHPGPHWIVDNFFLKRTARCTSEKGYPTTFDKKARTFWVDADAVIHSYTRLSHWLRIDLSQTPLAVRSDRQGGMVLDMDGPPTGVPRQDKARVRLDAHALRILLNEAFGESFEVETMELGDGKARLNGKARSATMDGIVGLFALFAIAAGHNPNIGDTRLKASVDIEQHGDRLHIRPEFRSRKVLDRLADTMRKRGMAAEVRDGHVEVATADVMDKYDIESLKLTPAGLLLEASTAPRDIVRQRR